MAWLLDYLANQGIDSASMAARHGIDVGRLLEADARVSAAYCLRPSDIFKGAHWVCSSAFIVLWQPWISLPI